ncbi:MAG: alpha/beta fold hydrolase, partial [Micromonosporaceae bacterium]
LAEAAARGDGEAVSRALAAEVPPELRADPAANAFLGQQARTLLSPGLSSALPGLAGRTAVPELSVLRRVTAPALVLGCRGDRLHPGSIAQRLAAALPGATLHLYAAPGVLWNQRADLRARISSFLSA